jgi:outer membrane protein TolC
MRGLASVWRRLKARLLRGLAAPALLAAAGAEFPAESRPAALPVTNETPAAAQPAPASVRQPLDLQACRKIALQHQPAVAAARASLAAAAARAQAVDNLHLPSFLARDLPVRRKQAALGVVIAEAAVTRAEGDTLYGVTFSYISALYAATQRQVAKVAIEDLEFLDEQARKAVAKGLRGVTSQDVDKVELRLLRARARNEEALQGEQRALSALREAMGVGPDCPPQLAHQELLDANPPVDLPQLRCAALERRGELIQAANAARVTAYEVDAQCLRLLPSARTFAANSDIHAQAVPPGSYGGNYRPGGVALEMPATITGSRCDRIEQARAYHARAEAVVDKTRKLITLEAEQAYFHWREAFNQEKYYRRASAQAALRFGEVQKKTRAGVFPPGSIDDYLYFAQLKNEMRVAANLARYQKVLALAALERITAGGFCAGFEAPEAVRPLPASESQPGEKGW